MDRKKILEEGLLEKYLLDELTDSDRHTVEKLLREDAGLKSKFELLEADFEQMAFENAIDPDTRVKKSLKARIEAEKVKKTYFWPLFAAASLALLFMTTTFLLYSKWQDSKKDLESVLTQTTNLRERLNILEQRTEVAETKLNIVNSVNSLPFLLKGNSKLPNAHAIAYVNHKDKVVVVNPGGLPELPHGQTYQIWSDVDGEMINMGLLSPHENLIAVNYIEKAESLNITIEPAGGSEHPTVENLISSVIF